MTTQFATDEMSGGRLRCIVVIVRARRGGNQRSACTSQEKKMKDGLGRCHMGQRIVIFALVVKLC
jgi:hypothetical protein